MNLVCRLLLEKNFFNDTATTEIYTLSLHDALPILTAIPGMAIVQASSLLNYIIGMAIAFAVAFALSLTLKYKTDAE